MTMSNFPKNLSILRRRAGYTQEGLAEALGVSRQAVSKWESGLTLPEAATLLTLSELLGCTLDQLMREELTDMESNDAGGGLSREELAAFEAYDAHMNHFALTMAFGVALVLMGVALLLALSALGAPDGLIAAPLLLCVAAAVFLFISGGISHGDFQKENPQIPTCYSHEEQSRFRRTFRLGLSLSVAFVLADVAFLTIFASFSEGRETAQTWAVALFMLVLAGAVGTMVLLGILHSKYNPEEYASAGEEPWTPKEGSKWSGVIMLSATAIFLAAGFLFGAWHPAWVAFPIGGILCAIAESLTKK